MIVKTAKFISQVVLFCSALLLILSIVGLFKSYDARSRLDPSKNAPEVLYSEIEKAYNQYGESPEFVQQALTAFEKGIIFEWPHELGRIPITDNWILYFLSYLEGPLNQVGVITVEDFFSVYQSLRYERAIERGFGICSQNALAFSDLLERKYDMQTQIIYLEGHVTSSVILDDQQVVIDPSIGWYSGKTLKELEQQPEFVRAELSKLKWEELAKTYDEAGNQVFEGVEQYNPKMKKLEHWFDLLKFILPLVMIILSGWSLIILRHKQKADA